MLCSAAEAMQHDLYCMHLFCVAIHLMMSQDVLPAGLILLRWQMYMVSFAAFACLCPAFYTRVQLVKVGRRTLCTLLRP